MQVKSLARRLQLGWFKTWLTVDTWLGKKYENISRRLQNILWAKWLAGAGIYIYTSAAPQHESLLIGCLIYFPLARGLQTKSERHIKFSFETQFHSPSRYVILRYSLLGLSNHQQFVQERCCYSERPKQNRGHGHLGAFSVITLV